MNGGSSVKPAPTWRGDAPCREHSLPSSGTFCLGRDDASAFLASASFALRVFPFLLTCSKKRIGPSRGIGPSSLPRLPGRGEVDRGALRGRMGIFRIALGSGRAMWYLQAFARAVHQNAVADDDSHRGRLVFGWGLFIPDADWYGRAWPMLHSPYGRNDVWRSPASAPRLPLATRL